MALETGTYISDLVATNPTSGDPKSQGDDHFRLLKSTIQATFPSITGAVTPTHTELNYVAGATSSIQTQLTRATLTSGSVQATTSGTSIDFTSIPSWVKRITVNLAGVSTSGTSNPLIQIGDSGGIETSSYVGAATATQNAVATVATSFTTGFGIVSGVAANTLSGSIVLSLIDASTNTWVASGSVAYPSTLTSTTAGYKALSATLDRIRLTTVGGSDTFDAGSANILYE